ncbi:Uncharacterized protein Rs2_31275 [Raphanus sativus]|nr:Uncharacterized protein Rs2_31275 [Raphanus sativus]
MYGLSPLIVRKYAFERPDVPAGEQYVLKINYPFKDPALKGESFCAVLGSHTRCTLIALSRGSSQSHPPSKVIIREAPSQALTTQDHEKEIVPFAQEPGVAEYATVMEKIVRGLSLKTSFGEQRLWSLCPFVVVVSVCPFDDTYTIMWSLCPFVEDEIMNRA